MTPERWATIEMLSWRLMELPEDARTTVLDEAREADPELAREVETLLQEWTSDPAFMESPILPDRPETPELVDSDETRFGNFRVVRPLGRGGMGEVFLAVEETEGVRRHVALKVVRSGLAHPELIERFQRERQILASLDHPSIARMLQVGSAEDGRPYLVMEYIDGIPLTEFVTTAGMDRDASIRLFQRVCEAVHHAHHRLIVHHDLKPANVLVTPEGEPKLLDFGISSVLEPDPEGTGTDQESTLHPLTPAYASPEHLRGEATGIPSDIYSLGALLYEILAGARAHPSEGAVEAMADRPAPPSTHRPDLAGDLDAIVLKAMDPDPDRRYWSAAALSEDLGRTLDHQPVQARPHTRGYLAGRFVRRNSLLVGGTAALLILLTAFSVITADQSRRIRIEADRVAQERDEALAVRSFLLESFGTTGPDTDGDALTARQLLDGRAAVLDEQYGDDPALHAEMMGVVAEGYEQLGLFEDAEPLARAALDLRLEQLSPDDPDLPAAFNSLGWIIHQSGRLEEAESVLQEAVSRGRLAHPTGHPTLARALNDLGVNLEAQGEYEEAEEAYTESLSIRRALLGDEDAVVAVTASNLSVVRYRRGDLAGASAMAREAHALFVRTLGPDHQRSMIVENNLAAMEAAAGETDSARETYRDILERRRRIFGERHPNTAQSMTALATMIPAGEGDSEAEALLTEALDIQLETLGPDHPTLANTSRRLAGILSRAGRPVEAQRLFEEALRVQVLSLGESHPQVAETLVLLGASRIEAGELDSAIDAYREALAIQESTLGPDHPSVARSEVALAMILLDQRELPAAAARLQRAREIHSAAELAPNHLTVQEARIAYVRLHALRGDTVRADSVLTEIERLMTDDQRPLLIGQRAARLREMIPPGSR